MSTAAVSGVRTENFTLVEADSFKVKAADDNLELLDPDVLEQLWNRELIALEKKLQSFRHDFTAQFYGYTPEFMLDMFYLKNINITSPPV